MTSIGRHKVKLDDLYVEKISSINQIFVEMVFYEFKSKVVEQFLGFKMIMEIKGFPARGRDLFDNAQLH